MKVLLVDVDLAVLRQMRNGSGDHDDIDLLTAQNWDEATELLGLVEVGLVVGGISTAHGVGMAALRRLQARGQRVAALGPDVPEIIRSSAEVGVRNYIHKPLSSAAFFARVRPLLREEAPTAALTGFALPDLLQLLASSGQTMTLQVRCKKEVGELVVARGALVHAAAGEQRGLDAASTILGWTGAQVSSIPDAPAPDAWSCDVPLMQLLLDAARVRDERLRDEARDRLTTLISDVAQSRGVLATALVHETTRAELLGESKGSFDRELGLDLVLDALALRHREVGRPNAVRLQLSRCDIVGSRINDSGVMLVVWVEREDILANVELREIHKELIEHLPNALAMISVDIEPSDRTGDPEQM